MIDKKEIQHMRNLGTDEEDIQLAIKTINKLRNGNSTKLRLERKKLKITQKELSELSEVSLCTLQKLETGLNDINKASVSTIMKLTKVLNISVEELLQDKETSLKNAIILCDKEISKQEQIKDKLIAELNSLNNH